MSLHNHTQECLACGESDLELVLELGPQSNVNRLLGSIEDAGDQPRTPLELCVCPNCGHGQLGVFMDPKDLFVDYLYASSTSRSLQEYSKSFATALADVQNNSRVLEIASNDGILLRELKQVGLQPVGVEPATRMVQRAVSEGLDVVEDFWPTTRLGQRKFDFIVGQNVLAHTPDPRAFLAGVEKHLLDDGLAVFQTSQADMVANGEFDTIYHEHYSFFSERSAATLGERVGLSLASTSYSKIHGTSSIYVFSKKNSIGIKKAALLAKALGARLGEVDAQSQRASALRVSRSVGDWREFASLASHRMEEVRQEVSKARSEGKSIVAVGAAAKGLTFLKAAGIRPDHVVDEAKDKVGLFVDDLNVQITSLNTCEGIQNPFFVVTAWNFFEELQAKVKSQRQGYLDPFLVYFPRVQVTIA